MPGKLPLLECVQFRLRSQMRNSGPMKEAPMTEAPEKLGLRERNKLDKMARIRRGPSSCSKPRGSMLRLRARLPNALTSALARCSCMPTTSAICCSWCSTTCWISSWRKRSAGWMRARSIVAGVWRVLAFLPGFPRARDARAILLRELVFYSVGKQAGQFVANRQRLMSGLERLAVQAAEKGKDSRGRRPCAYRKGILFPLFGRSTALAQQPGA